MQSSFLKLYRSVAPIFTRNVRTRSGGAPLDLIIVRAGESELAASKRIAGWLDDSLTGKGGSRARSCGKLIASTGVNYDLAFVSCLQRGQETMNCLLKAGRIRAPVCKMYELNDRHFGALTGMNAKEIDVKYSARIAHNWFNNFHAKPPPIGPDNVFYKDIHKHIKYKYRPRDNDFPLAESLSDCSKRLSKFWESGVKPQLLNRKKLILVTHLNAIRGILRFVYKLKDSETLCLDIPRCIPMELNLDDDARTPLEGITFVAPKQLKKHALSVVGVTKIFDTFI